MRRQLHQLLQQSRRHWRNHLARHQPLLDRHEQQQLQQFAVSSLNTPFIARHDVQQRLLGERLSSFTGSGYEFAENRLFQAGDDARFINWRLYARTGQLYRKIFHEERRPQLWLIVDRRSSMRFGTRTRLKVTAAVRQALVYLYQAQQQQLAVGCVSVEQPIQWFDASATATSLQTLVDYLVSPCPPLSTESSENMLDNVIRQLHNRLLPGSLVILLSDFHDLQASRLANLHQLTQSHTVTACHILDDIELQLPSHGRYRIATEDGNDTVLLDCTNEAAKQNIEQQLQLRQQQIQQWLTGAGLQYQSLLTSDEPFQLTAEVQTHAHR